MRTQNQIRQATNGIIFLVIAILLWLFGDRNNYNVFLVFFGWLFFIAAIYYFWLAKD